MSVPIYSKVATILDSTALYSEAFLTNLAFPKALSFRLEISKFFSIRGQIVNILGSVGQEAKSRILCGCLYKKRESCPQFAWVCGIVTLIPDASSGDIHLRAAGLRPRVRSVAWPVRPTANPVFLSAPVTPRPEGAILCSQRTWLCHLGPLV